MDFSILFSIFLVIGFFLYQWARRNARKASPRHIPGPKPSNSSEGNLEDIKSAGSLPQFLVKYHRLHGPIISFWLGQQMCVSIASAKLFQQHSAHFDRAALFFECLLPLIGETSIQVTNGSEGRRRHAAYSKAFSPSAVKKFYDVFNKLGKGLVKNWQIRYEEGRSIILQDEMHETTIQAILESTFGEEFEDRKLTNDVHVAYEYCWDEMDKFSVGDLAAPGSARETEFQAKKQFLRDVINRAASNRKERHINREDKLPIDAVLDLGLSDSTVTNELLTLVVAGFHTTASLLIWCIQFLATNQDIQDKIRVEVRSVVGSSDEVTHKMVEQLKYLRQVLKETLRFAGVGTFAARVHDSALMIGGYEIPAQTPVMHALAVSMHDDQVYPEPDRFDPDRFSPENERLLPPFSFEPFGFGGKRKCPGYNFSYSEATTILAQLIRAFRIEFANDQPVQPVFGLMTKLKDNLFVRAKPV